MNSRIARNPRSYRLLALSIGFTAALLLLGAWFALAGRTATAHGVQIASEPAPSEQLSESPPLITVTYNEPIEPSVSTIELYDQQARPVDLGDYEFFDDPAKMGVHVPSELPSGIYTVIWRNLSTVDAHTWQGSFSFTVLGPGGEVPSGGVPPELQGLAGGPSNNPSTLESAARWIVLLGSAVILGGAAYLVFVATPALRNLGGDTQSTLRTLSRTVLLVTGAIGVFLVLEGSLIQLVLQADRLGGIERADDLLVDTRFGHYLIARQALLLFALAALGLYWRLRGRASETFSLGLLLLASIGVLLTQSLVSHAAASDGEFWATTTDFLHLLAASFWVGALIHIGLSMPRWLDALAGVPRTLFAAESFRRFSILAAASVIVLMASGVLSALVQFRAWDELWSSSYGWALISKLLAMLPLLGVAGLNAFILRPRVVNAGMQIAGGATDSGEAVTAEEAGRLQRLLGNTVRLEAVLGIVVLIAAAVLIQLQSPRVAAEVAEASGAPAPTDSEGPFALTEEKDGLSIGVTIGSPSAAPDELGPPLPGENRFEMGIGAEFGEIGDVQLARFQFTPPGETAGGATLDLEPAGTAPSTAAFASEGTFLSLPGEWTVSATIRREGEDDTKFDFKVPVGVTESSESIWDWPFEGRRSVAAIAVLSLVGVVGVGWVALRAVRSQA